jgi:hypothetical protein
MHWSRAHTKTAAAGLASIALAALLFRPASAATGLLAVLLIVVLVTVSDGLMRRQP